MKIRVCFHSYPERFVRSFLRRIRIKRENECWPWLRTTSDGYGKIRFKGRMKSSHRVSYEIFKGPIPEGLLVCHSCDNRRCCNPKHLWLGTDASNTKDKVRKGRQPRGESNGKAKLTEKDVLEIRLLIKKRNSLTNIAIRFNVTSQLIGRIKRGQVWKHLS